MAYDATPSPRPANRIRALAVKLGYQPSDYYGAHTLRGLFHDCDVFKCEGCDEWLEDKHSARPEEDYYGYERSGRCHYCRWSIRAPWEPAQAIAGRAA